MPGNAGHHFPALCNGTSLSGDWHTMHVDMDLKEGGTFLFRMETKDGSLGFDHCGKYDTVITNELIEYTVSDGRKSVITFMADGNETIVTETFEAEKETPVEMQKDFCQGVLNNFKQYAEKEMAVSL